MVGYHNGLMGLPDLLSYIISTQGLPFRSGLSAHARLVLFSL